MKFCKNGYQSKQLCTYPTIFIVTFVLWSFIRDRYLKWTKLDPEGTTSTRQLNAFSQTVHTMMLDMDNEVTKQIENRDIAKCWCASAENDTWDQTKPWADCGPAPILLLQSIFHSRPVTFTLFTSRFLQIPNKSNRTFCRKMWLCWKWQTKTGKEL